jgi:bacteriocin leader peptide (microcyclamide/patellamide family)
MDQKNLRPIAAGPVNPTTTGELPAELVELSEEDLQKIVGGRRLLGWAVVDGVAIRTETSNLWGWAVDGPY